MHGLVRSVMPCEVEVNGRLHLVRRPTVGEAFTVLAAGPDPDAWPHVERVVRDIFGADLSEDVLVAGPGIALDMVSSMLRFGMPDPEPTPDGEQAKSTSDLDGSFLVALYAWAFKMPPSAVLQESWPLFIEMLGEIDRLRASDQLDAIGWYVSAKTGKADDIARRAGGRSFRTFVEPDIMRDPEWIAEQFEVIARLRAARARA